MKLDTLLGDFFENGYLFQENLVKMGPLLREILVKMDPCLGRFPESGPLLREISVQTGPLLWEILVKKYPCQLHTCVCKIYKEPPGGVHLKICIINLLCHSYENKLQIVTNLSQINDTYSVVYFQCTIFRCNHDIVVV